MAKETQVTLVTGRLRLDDSGFHQALSRARTGVLAFSSAFQGAIMGASMAGATALGRFLSSVIETGFQLDKLRKQTIFLAGGLPSLVNRAFAELPKVARETGVASEELATSLYFVVSAGLRGAEGLEVVRAAAKASAAGLGDMASITRVIVSALNAWGKENLSAAAATDALVAAVREGVLAPEEMANALGGVLGLAAQLGLTFQQTAGIVAGFTRFGLDAAEAVTALRAVLVQLVQGSAETRKSLQQAGLSIHDLSAALKGGRIVEFLSLLKKGFETNSDAMQRAFGDVRSLVGVLNLVGERGQIVADVIDKVANSAGDLDKAFAGTEGKARDFARAAENLRAAGREALVPIFEGVRVVAGAFATATESAKPLITAVSAGLAGAAVIAGIRSLASAVSSLGASFAGAATKAGTLVGVVSNVRAGFGTLLTLSPLIGVALATWFDSMNKLTGPLPQRIEQLKEDTEEFVRALNLIQKQADILSKAGVKGVPAIPAQLTPEQLANLEVQIGKLWREWKQGADQAKTATDALGQAVQKTFSPDALTQAQIAWSQVRHELELAFQKGGAPEVLEKAKQIGQQLIAQAQKQLKLAQTQEDANKAALDLAQTRLEVERTIRQAQEKIAKSTEGWLRLRQREAELFASEKGDLAVVEEVYRETYEALIQQELALGNVLEAEQLRVELAEKLLSIQQQSVANLPVGQGFQALPGFQARYLIPALQSKAVLGAMASMFAEALVEAFGSSGVKGAAESLMSSLGRFGMGRITDLIQRAFTGEGGWKKALGDLGFLTEGGGANWAKIGALAGLAIGGQIWSNAQQRGNRGQGALGGAIAGASLGMMTGNPLVAVIAAIIGGALGYFTSGAKKTGVHIGIRPDLKKVFADITGPTEEEERQIAEQIRDRYKAIASTIREALFELRLPFETFKDIQIEIQGEVADFNTWLNRFLASDLPRAMFEPMQGAFQQALEGMGVSSERASQELQAVLNASDFQAAMQRFIEWVRTLKSLQDMVAKAPSLQELRSRTGEGALTAAQRNVTEVLGELQYTLDNFANMTTEEQVRAAQAAQQSLQSQIQAIEQSIQALEQLRHQLVSSIQDFLESEELLAADREGAGLEFRLGKYQQALERLNSAANETELQQAVTDTLRWAGELRQAREALYQLKDALASIREDVASLQQDVAKTLAGGEQSGLAGWREARGALLSRIEELSRGIAELAPEDAVQRLRQIAQLQRERYQLDLQMLERIKGIQESIAAQYQDALAALEEAQAEDQGPQALGQLLVDRIRKAYEALQQATDPEEIQRLWEEINQNAQRLLGMRGEINLQSEAGEPLDIFAWLRQLLESAQGIAQTKLEGAEDEVRSDLENLQDALGGLQNLISGEEGSLDALIGQINDALGKLPGAIDAVNAKLDLWQQQLDALRTQLLGVAGELIAGLQGLNAELAPWRGTGTAPTNGGGGGGGGGGGNGDDEGGGSIRVVNQLSASAASAAGAINELAEAAAKMSGNVAINVYLDPALMADVWGAVELVRLRRAS